MKICFLLLVSITVSGCVSTKKQIYLQPSQEVQSNQYEIKNYTEKSYLLAPEDIISIKISSLTPMEFDHLNTINNSTESRYWDPLLLGYLIDEDGFITLPVAGKVQVKGLTIKETQNKLAEVLEEYLDSPTVYIRLLSFRFTVLGEVLKPGTFTSYNTRMNILQAIGMASGLTIDADRENISLIRSEGGTSTINKINVLEDKLLAFPYYYLQPNDIIIVPPLKTKNFRQNQVTNISLILSALSVVSLILIRLEL